MWREKNDTLRIDIWWSEELDSENMECIEAEVVYVIRKESGQWPADQCEIHFHESDNFHRDAAKIIYNTIINQR